MPKTLRKSRALFLFMALLLVFVTACGQKSEAPKTSAPSQTTTPAPQPAKPAVFNGAWPFLIAPKGHFNSFVATTYTLVGASPYADLVEEPMGMYRWADNSWMPLLATSWEVQGDNFVAKLRTGVKWSDGADFTADDVVTTFTVARLMKNVVWNYIDKVEAKDKSTVSFHMSKPSTVVQRYILRERIRPSSVYGEWAKKVNDLVARDAKLETDAYKQLRLEFEQFRPKDVIGTGPYKIDTGSITEAQMTLTRVPTAWNANTVKFEKIVLHSGETPTVTPLVLAKQVDYATHAFPPATEKQFEQTGLGIVRPPTYSGPALFFNHKNAAFQKPEVRQAFAHVIDRAEAGTVSLGKSGVATRFVAGFSDNLVPNWVSADDQKKFNPYPKDEKKAEELLQKAGFKKGSDGVWVTDKGARMEYELMVPSEYADWSATAETVAQQLTKFGIKTTVRGVTFSQVPIDIDAGKFALAIYTWGTGHPHPHFSFTRDLFERNYVQVNGPGMGFEMKQKTADGEVDFQALIVNAAEGMDEAKQKAAVTRAALAFNQLLPIIPLWERYGNNPTVSDRVQGWPADSDPILKNAVYADNPIVMKIMDGTIRPK